MEQVRGDSNAPRLWACKSTLEAKQGLRCYRHARNDRAGPLRLPTTDFCVCGFPARLLRGGSDSQTGSNLLSVRESIVSAHRDLCEYGSVRRSKRFYLPNGRCSPTKGANERAPLLQKSSLLPAKTLLGSSPSELFHDLEYLA